MTTTEFPFTARANFDGSVLAKLRSAKRIEAQRVGTMYVFGVHIQPHLDDIARWAAEHQEQNPVPQDIAASLDTASILIPDNWWFAREDIIVASRSNLAFELLKDILAPYGKEDRRYKKALKAAEAAW